MSNRTCGSCTACCEGWLHAEKLDMRPGRPCRHCTKQGCAIYEDRPEDPCVRFRCGWLNHADRFPDEMRPDRAGVIVLHGRKSHGWDAILAIPAGNSVPADALEWLRLHAQEQGMPLVFYERRLDDGEYTGVKVRALGPARFAEAIKYYVGPADIVKM